MSDVAITLVETTVVVQPVEPALVMVTQELVATVEVLGVPGPRGLTGDTGPVGPVGPQGIQGPAGYANLLSIAAVDLGGHRAVVSLGNGTVGYADCNTLAHAGRVVGITTHAAVRDAQIELAVGGELIEPTWSWSDGPVFVGANGVLTQAPTGSFIQRIGVALAPTRLAVLINQPIIPG